jgi:ADP-ribose pyrophosphatase YjhB (NUDIX family)
MTKPGTNMTDSATQDVIRPIVMCLFRKGTRILVCDLHDPSRNRHFYRPMGGGIEFGETSLEALRREVREELDAEIVAPTLLGTLENIFIYDDRRGHEVVFVYYAQLVDESLYRKSRLQGIEDNGLLFELCWLDISTLGPDSPPLYPEGLLDLLAT